MWSFHQYIPNGRTEKYRKGDTPGVHTAITEGIIMQSGIYISITLILQDSRSVDVTILSSMIHHAYMGGTFHIHGEMDQCNVITQAICGLLSRIQFELMKVMTLFLFHNLWTIVGCPTSREKSCYISYSELLASIECQHLHVWWTMRQMPKASVNSSCLSRHAADHWVLWV